MKVLWETIRLLIAGGSNGNLPFDPRFKRILWQIVAGTRGGPNRGRILKTLSERPLNAHQLSTELNLDYKTTQHHLRVLLLNNLITASEQPTYGALYFLTPDMEEGLAILDSILAKLGHRQISGSSVGVRCI